MMNSSELRSRRIHLGLSRTDLAREVGVDVQTVTAWEAGEISIDSPQLLDSTLRNLSSRQSVRAEMRDRV